MNKRYLVDRSINDRNVLCEEWDMTAEKFIDTFLPYEYYAYALDPESGTELLFECFETSLDDYSALSSEEIKDIGTESFSWLEEVGERRISAEVISLNQPYFKVITKGEDYFCYYYETVENGELFMFSFMIDPADLDPSLEQLYDEIVQLSLLNG